ncbi:base excision dna repair protein [Colletotrichum incanum]|uniref:Base excision dna repair protein n=1 Tax=Colletotrichum incanum TaxID=1573173 RepID=A0A161W5S1_COLIC|nr:base excision dna repair protein [Colletotrichum incanum]
MNSIEEKTEPFSLPEPNVKTEAEVETETGQEAKASFHIARQKLSDRTLKDWSKQAHSSPYPDSLQPTPGQCQIALEIMEKLYSDQVRENFTDRDAPPQEYIIRARWTPLLWLRSSRRQAGPTLSGR